MRRAPPPPTQLNGTRPESIPPRRLISPTSEEDRNRPAGKLKSPPEELNIFADPSDKSRERRPRRNSETSVREKTTKFLDPNDDRRRRERRHRDSKRDGKPKGPSRKLDIIDKLDVTGIYGGGRE